MMGAGRAVLASMTAATLLAGLLAGLQRLGLEAAFVPGTDLWGPHHGALMVSGFFGTVIGFERAAALDRGWVWAAPTLTVAGAWGLLFSLASPGPEILFLMGSLVFLAGAILSLRRRPGLDTAALAAAAAAWPTGIIAWIATGLILPAVPAWATFLILTIAGERVELSRFLPPHPARGPAAALVAVALLAGGLAAAAGVADGIALFSLGLLGLTLWLFRFDVIRHTLRQRGLPRYSAVCLAGGYLWLGFAGAIGLAFGLPDGGPVYDALLHSLFVGFVFAMVFGHMPIILPALLGIGSPYHPVLYLPLLLLQTSLLARIAGDLGGRDDLRLLGGTLNGAAVLLFLATTALIVVLQRQHRRLDPGRGLE